MARDFNQNRNANAKLVKGSIDTLGVTFAAQAPYKADGFFAVDVAVENANPTQKDFLEGADFTMYAIGKNITKLCNYALASFPDIEKLWLFSTTMVDIDKVVGGDYLDYLTDANLKIYVPASLLSSYNATYGQTGMHLEGKFEEINEDYVLTISGSGTLTTTEINNQLMNGTYDSTDRSNCTKIVIQGFSDYMAAVWAYNFSQACPNLNNNIYYNNTKLGFSEYTIQDNTEDHILTASVVETELAKISADKITLVEKIIVPIDFIQYASGSITAIQNSLSNLRYLETTYGAGAMELDLQGDIVSKITSINKTLDEALVYGKTFVNTYDNTENMDYAFQKNNVDLIVLPPIRFTSNSIVDGMQCFEGCSNLVYIAKLKNNVMIIQGTCSGCDNLIEVNIEVNSVYRIYNALNMSSLKRISILSTNNMPYDTSTLYYSFLSNNLEKIILQNLIFGSTMIIDLTNKLSMTREAIVDLINSLGTPVTQQTLTIGATNLAKLTADDIAIATAKNWQLV